MYNIIDTTTGVCISQQCGLASALSATAEMNWEQPARYAFHPAALPKTHSGDSDHDQRRAESGHAQ